MNFQITKSCAGKGSIPEVAKIAFPLVVASIGHGVNLFTDRLMLSRYSEEAMAAAFPAGLTSFTMSCFFLGIIGYAGVFVAQYFGARQFRNAGLAVWQAIFLAVIGGMLMLLSTLFAEDMFRMFGHDETLIDMEIKYYTLLSWAGFVPLTTVAFSTFWSGRAKTRTIMIVNLIITLFNIPLNALLIYGWQFNFGNMQINIPELGITGAALGTIGAGIIGMMIFIAGFFMPSVRKEYSVCQNPFNWNIFIRLIRFGTPNGIQLVLELATFNIFVILLGKISVDVLIASTVVMSAYSLAFNPMIGFGQAAAILVGQGVGAKDIAYAERSVASCRTLVTGYSILMMIVFLCFPDLILNLFDIESENVRHISKIMLIFTCVYLVFDAFNILYSNAVKGAGDTKFTMWTGIILGWLIYALPCVAAYYLLSGKAAVEFFGREKADSINVWTLWTLSEIYIILLGLIFFIRFQKGKWKSMNVID